MVGLMKILIVANYKENSGGISVQVKSIVSHLVEDGHLATIFTTSGSLMNKMIYPFALLLKGRDYDVFHIHCCSYRGFFPAVLGIMIGKLLKKTIILTYHGGDADAFFNKRTRFVKFFLSRTDTNVVLSKYHGMVFKKYDLPYVVIPNVFEYDEEHFRLRSEICPKFICIRSHTETYNIKCIIDAFSKVKQVYESATLTLIGDGLQHQELKDYAAQLDVNDIVFLGRIPNARIFEHLDNSDIMLSSPVIDNMPISLLEGFSAGLLVISSNVGGVPFMIENGKNGLLFESGNSNDLCGKMVWALEHQENSKEMILSAKDSLRAYSWDIVGSRLYSIFNA